MFQRSLAPRNTSVHNLHNPRRRHRLHHLPLIQIHLPRNHRLIHRPHSRRLLQNRRHTRIIRTQCRDRSHGLAIRRIVDLEMDTSLREQSALILRQLAIDLWTRVDGSTQKTQLNHKAEVDFAVYHHEELVGAGMDVWEEDAARAHFHEVCGDA